MEKWEKTNISGNSRRPVLVQVNLYRYSLGSGHFGQPVSVQVRAVSVQLGFWSFFANLYRYSDLYRYTLLYFDQCSYFSHNLLISYPN